MSRIFISMMLLACIASGCAQGSSSILAGPGINSQPVSEVGFTEIIVEGTYKTHSPGLFSAADSHGTADYRLLLKIDGQSLWLNGDPQEDPEGGTRYRFRQELRLKSGIHRVAVIIPNGVQVEKELHLAEGVSRLVLEPVYGSPREKVRPGGVSPARNSYMEGIRTFRLVLNGTEM